MAQPPVITYGARLIQPGADLQIIPNPQTDHTTPYRTAKYGDYGGVSETANLKARCELTVSYSNVTYVVNNDNSITVSGNITGGVLKRTYVASSTNRQEITVWFNNQQVFHTIIDTDQAGTWNLNIPHSFSVTIQPSDSPQTQYPASIHFKNHNTGSTLPPDEWDLGIEILNPNPPDYRPGCIRNSSSMWLSHNRTGGEAHILTSDSGSWREMRTEGNLATAGNPPSIRINDKWMNQRKIGKE
jgi:hypothetical protein